MQSQAVHNVNSYTEADIDNKLVALCMGILRLTVKYVASWQTHYAHSEFVLRWDMYMPAK